MSNNRNPIQINLSQKIVLSPEKIVVLTEQMLFHRNGLHEQMLFEESERKRKEKEKEKRIELMKSSMKSSIESSNPIPANPNAIQINLSDYRNKITPSFAMLQTQRETKKFVDNRDRDREEEDYENVMKRSYTSGRICKYILESKDKICSVYICRDISLSKQILMWLHDLSSLLETNEIFETNNQFEADLVIVCFKNVMPNFETATKAQILTLYFEGSVLSVDKKYRGKMIDLTGVF